MKRSETGKGTESEGVGGGKGSFYFIKEIKEAILIR